MSQARCLCEAEKRRIHRISNVKAAATTSEPEAAKLTSDCLVTQRLVWMQRPAAALYTMNLAAMKKGTGHTRHSNSEPAAGGLASIAGRILEPDPHQTYPVSPLGRHL